MLTFGFFNIVVLVNYVSDEFIIQYADLFVNIRTCFVPFFCGEVSADWVSGFSVHANFAL